MSESINLGQINKSTDIKIIGKVIDIKIGLTPISKRFFAKIISEKSISVWFNNKKANCHSFTKINLHSAINTTGTEKKNRDGLWDTLSIEKNSFKLKSNLINSSAHLENLMESEDIEKPKLKW